MFVTDLKENYGSYGLPQEFVDLLPEYCESCGSPLEISEVLTGLHCSNPRCTDKIVKRIEMICSDLNILYFGESTIQKFVEYYGLTNPMNMFALEGDMIISDEVSPEVSRKIVEQIEQKKDFLLWEYVMYANLPYIKTNARKIFQGYETLEKAYEDIERGGVDFIQKKLGIHNEGEVSVQAMKTYATLMEYKDDLFESLVDVHIISMRGRSELNVVCSDQVGGGFKKKPEFYAYVKKKYGDKVQVNFLSSASKSIDYLIWQGADGSPARYTNKVKSVEGWNAKGSNIPIMTATQFLEELNRKYT